MAYGDRLQLLTGSAQPLLLCIASFGFKAWGNAPSWCREALYLHHSSREAGTRRISHFQVQYEAAAAASQRGKSSHSGGRADAEWPPKNDSCSLTADLTHFPWEFAVPQGFSVSVLLTFWGQISLWGDCPMCIVGFLAASRPLCTRCQ